MRIIITGDAQRPQPPQAANIAWLFHTISSQIQAVTGITPETIPTPSLLSTDDWLKTYTDPTADYWLAQQNLKDAIVIGYELPWNATAYMRELKIPFIDITTHPIRFLDDLMLGFDSNILKLDHIPQPSALTMTIQANLIKAQMGYKPRLGVPPNTALIIGQTNIDRSLICENKILSLKDFTKEIQDISKTHSKVIFKPHPANKDLNIPNVETVHDNIYSLFSNSSITTVCGISSSCLSEAPYFGLKSIFFGPNHQAGRTAVTAQDFISPGLWQGLFGQLMPTIKNPNFDIAPKPSRLRRSCNSYWGFDVIDKS